MAWIRQPTAGCSADFPNRILSLEDFNRHCGVVMDIQGEECPSKPGRGRPDLRKSRVEFFPLRVNP